METVARKYLEGSAFVAAPRGAAASSCNAMNTSLDADIISSLPEELRHCILSSLESPDLNGLLGTNKSLSIVASGYITSAQTRKNEARLINLNKYPRLESLDLRRSYALSKLELATALGATSVRELSIRFDQLRLTSPSNRQVSQLRHLTLVGCFDPETFSVLSDFPDLRSLDIEYSNNRPETYNFESLGRLLSLNLSRSDNLKTLNGLNLGNYLKTLRLSCCRGLGDISELSKLMSLTSLDLSWTALKSISSVQSLQNLRLLNLRGCEVNDGINLISNLRSLEELDLSSYKGDFDIKSFSGLTNLVKLDLSMCPQAQNFTQVHNLNSLRILSLARCNLSSDLIDLPRLTKSLDLSHNPHLRNISSIENLKELRTLNVDGCPQLQDITALKGLVNLEKLSLRYCREIRDFSCLRRLRILKSVNVYGCAYTDSEAFRELSLAMPQCNIISSSDIYA